MSTIGPNDLYPDLHAAMVIYHRTPVPVQNPTPYQDINTLLQELLSSVQTILGQRFVGIYLHGSLALGDFTPQSSDIDFLVATDGDLPQDYVLALQAMHERLVALDARWGHELEGSYIPQRALRRYDPADAVHPHIERGGSLVIEHHHTDSVIQRHITREHGITLAGPPPSALIDRIPADDLRLALLALMRSWWAPMRHDPFRLRHRGYQVYAALTMCRMLYTMRHGAIVSKPAAGRWALEALGRRWAGLIERALLWPDGTPQDDVEETVALIQYVFDECERWQLSRGG